MSFEEFSEILTDETQELGSVTDTTTETDKPTTKRTTAWLPNTDVELLSLSKNVFANCAEMYFPTVFCTKAQLNVLNEGYTQALGQKQYSNTRKPRTGGDASVLEREMNVNLERVKEYLNEEFGARRAPEHFGAFGIEYINRTYKFPRNREGILNSLRLMTSAIVEYGFSDRKYGAVYWTGMLSSYQSVVAETYTTSSDITESTLSKNHYKTSVRRALRSVVKVVEANHPDDYASQLRIMGFQKEKY